VLFQLLRAHDERARHLLGQDLEDDITHAHDVAILEAGPFHPVAVHEDAVGAAGVPDGKTLRPGLQNRVAAGALGVVQDEVTRGVAAEHGHGPRKLDLMLRTVRVADL
jgi:hypothetical protein